MFTIIGFIFIISAACIQKKKKDNVSTRCACIYTLKYCWCFLSLWKPFPLRIQLFKFYHTMYKRVAVSPCLIWLLADFGVANLLFKCVFRWTPILVVSKMVSFMLLLGYIRISCTLCISFIKVAFRNEMALLKLLSMCMTDELIPIISSVGCIRCFI